VSGFTDCVGFADGTLFPFETTPMLDSEDWCSRKGICGMAALVVCDDDERIRFLCTGLPGCFHDQRVYDNTPLAQRPEEFFSPGQYLLADAGYAPRRHVIPAFKRRGGRELHPNERAFNDELSRICIRVEHCFGMLKGRFSSLRRLRMLIQDERDVWRCARWIYACVILHNLLLGDPVDEDWVRAGRGDEGGDDERDDRGRGRRAGVGSGGPRGLSEEGNWTRDAAMPAVIAWHNRRRPAASQS
jgi:DDE superfamily endonuclease